MSIKTSCDCVLIDGAEASLLPHTHSDTDICSALRNEIQQRQCHEVSTRCDTTNGRPKLGRALIVCTHTCALDGRKGNGILCDALLEAARLVYGGCRLEMKGIQHHASQRQLL